MSSKIQSYRVARWEIPIELHTWWGDTHVNLGHDRPERVARFLRFSRVSSKLLQQRIAHDFIRVFIIRWHHTKQRIAKNNKISFTLLKRTVRCVSITRKLQKAIPDFLMNVGLRQNEHIKTICAKTYRVLPMIISETMKDYKGYKLIFCFAWSQKHIKKREAVKRK